MSNFTETSLDQGYLLLEQRTEELRKAYGQYLTPQPIAKYMVQQLGTLSSASTILDPAMGSGTLLCALIEDIIEAQAPLEVTIDGFEIDQELFTIAQKLLGKLQKQALQQGIVIHLNLYCTDFLLDSLQQFQASFESQPVSKKNYDYILANPPYFKLQTHDQRRILSTDLLQGATNIYTLFMAMAGKLLSNGKACFIVPRSFCSGAYFKKFRNQFLSDFVIQAIHLFESRNAIFINDTILQENIILTLQSRKSNPKHNNLVHISTSASTEHLTEHNSPTVYSIQQDHIVNKYGLIRIPINATDKTLIDCIDSWPETFKSLDLSVSTGPVVAFRAAQYLQQQPNGKACIPLLWMQHVQHNHIQWPALRPIKKPEYIEHSAQTTSITIPNRNYILLRRFSTKEEARRLIAAPYLAHHYPYSYIGLENHLNYIYKADQQLSVLFCIGLAALLGSSLIDRYFRIMNGNTQVNATELRMLPLPPLHSIESLGNQIQGIEHSEHRESIVCNVLYTAELIDDTLIDIDEKRSQ